MSSAWKIGSRIWTDGSTRTPFWKPKYSAPGSLSGIRTGNRNRTQISRLSPISNHQRNLATSSSSLRISDGLPSGTSAIRTSSGKGSVARPQPQLPVVTEQALVQVRVVGVERSSIALASALAVFDTQSLHVCGSRPTGIYTTLSVQERYLFRHRSLPSRWRNRMSNVTLGDSDEQLSELVRPTTLLHMQVVLSS